MTVWNKNGKLVSDNETDKGQFFFLNGENLYVPKDDNDAKNVKKYWEGGNNKQNIIVELSDGRKINLNINNIVMTHVKDMSGMFKDAERFNQPLDHWDTQNVANMSGMFNGASSFNQNINIWNTQNVTNMSGMFSGASVFNQPLDYWNTRNVTDMSGMFQNAPSFNQNINIWNTQNVTNMSGMFSGASSFNQPLDFWNTLNVTDMSNMFSGASSFNQKINIWNTQNVTNMSRMFSGASVFNQPLDYWDTRNVTDMSNMFSGASSFNQPLTAWNVGKIASEPTNFSNSLIQQNKPNWGTNGVNNCKSFFLISHGLVFTSINDFTKNTYGYSNNNFKVPPNVRVLLMENFGKKFSKVSASVIFNYLVKNIYGKNLDIGELDKKRLILPGISNRKYFCNIFNHGDLINNIAFQVDDDETQTGFVCLNKDTPLSKVIRCNNSNTAQFPKDLFLNIMTKYLLNIDGLEPSLCGGDTLIKYKTKRFSLEYLLNVLSKEGQTIQQVITIGIISCRGLILPYDVNHEIDNLENHVRTSPFCSYDIQIIKNVYKNGIDNIIKELTDAVAYYDYDEILQYTEKKELYNNLNELKKIVPDSPALYNFYNQGIQNQTFGFYKSELEKVSNKLNSAEKQQINILSDKDNISEKDLEKIKDIYKKVEGKSANIDDVINYVDEQTPMDVDDVVDMDVDDMDVDEPFQQGGSQSMELYKAMIDIGLPLKYVEKWMRRRFKQD